MNIRLTNHPNLVEKWAIVKAIYRLKKHIYLLRYHVIIGQYKILHNKLEVGLEHSDKAIEIGKYIRDKLESDGIWNKEWPVSSLIRTIFGLDIAQAFSHRSDALYHLARLEDALAAASMAIQIIEDMRPFTSLETVLWLANAYSAYSTILFASNQKFEAKRAYDKVIELIENEKEWLGNNVELDMILVQHLVARAAITDELTDLDYASDLLQWLRTQKKPTSLNVIENYLLASVLSTKAHLLYLKDHVHALDVCDEAITIWESLENTSKISDRGMMSRYKPPYHQWLLSTAQLYRCRGELKKEKGDLVNAENDFQSSISKLEALSFLMPTNSDPKYKDLTPEHRVLLAGSYNSSFEICRLENRLAEAKQHSNISISIIETIPGNTLDLADLKRFEIYVNAASLLDQHDKPHYFAHEKSQRMAELLELTLWGKEEWDYRRQLRQLFAEFHAHWLHYCIKNKNEHIIPEILSIIQGRDLAAEVLDNFRLDESNTPETVRKFHELRLELRKINAHIQSIINGGRTSNNATDGFRTAMALFIY